MASGDIRGKKALGIQRADQGVPAPPWHLLVKSVRICPPGYPPWLQFPNSAIAYMVGMSLPALRI
ncbi:hypothetical protein FQZ97_1143810 [compost metagenome]